MPSASPQSGFWTRLDAAIYRVEVALVTLASLVMTVAIFLAVVWRQAAAPQTPHAGVVNARVLGGVLWLALCIFAVGTAKKTWSTVQKVALGSVLGAALWAASRLLVWALPEGLIFAQRLALSLMMWIVFLGSSMAAHTRRHIVLQAAQKLVAAESLRLQSALSLFLAAAFTLFLVFVSGRYAYNNLHTWLSSDFRAGIFESVAIPYWTVTMAIPLGLLLTALRFVGQGIAILRGFLSPVPLHEEVRIAQEAGS